MSQKNVLPEIQVQNLDHLGIVAGMVDELGIVERINELVGVQPGEIVSPGVAVKAMILNGLGMFTAPLYLFSKFFEGKPTEHLLGAGINPLNLNDDRLGRVLDKLYVRGVEAIFLAIALAATKKYHINCSSSHLDSTSFHVHGKYENQPPEVYFESSKVHTGSNGEASVLEKVSRTPITITYGYSRDRRPDLKQFMLDLICSSDGDVPLFMRVGSGNESDSAVFAQLFKDFKNQLDLDTIMVADSALYTAENLKLLENSQWLSRVPLRIKPAQELVASVKQEELTESKISGYRWAEYTSDYGAIKQRWLVVESDSRRQADLKKFEKNLAKFKADSEKQLRTLAQKEFACEADALSAATELSSKLKNYKLTSIQAVKVTKARKFSAQGEFYKIEAEVEHDSEAIALEKEKAGRFIIATNVLDRSKLSPEEMVAKYKDQQSAERGFGFLKDPLFFTDSVFLKSPERIEGLALIMGLCLLVYTLAQRYLRQELLTQNLGVKNQLGKLIQRPTLRWIFQCFQAVHFLKIDGVEQVANLTDERLNLLRFFPERVREYYLLV